MRARFRMARSALTRRARFRMALGLHPARRLGKMPSRMSESSATGFIVPPEAAAVEIATLAKQPVELSVEPPMGKPVKGKESGNPATKEKPLAARKTGESSAVQSPAQGGSASKTEASDARRRDADSAGLLTPSRDGESKEPAAASVAPAPSNALPGNPAAHPAEPSHAPIQAGEKAVAGQADAARDLQAEVRAGGAAGASAQIESARLVQRATQSEMKLNLQTSEFGRVDIHTSLSRHTFAAEILVEQDGMIPALTAELPGLHSRLNEHGVEASITLNAQPATASQAGAGEQQGRARPEARYVAETPRPTAPRALVMTTTTTLAARLDVHA